MTANTQTCSIKLDELDGNFEKWTLVKLTYTVCPACAFYAAGI